MNSAKPRLYVVDDDRYFIHGISKGLRIGDYCSSVLFFDDPEDAMETICENISSGEGIPDILFIDINMPEMDGWEFLLKMREIKEKTDRQIRIFIISSSVMESDMLKAISYPEVEAYLAKPLTRSMMESVFRID